jgi:hypothetical protein
VSIASNPLAVAAFGLNELQARNTPILNFFEGVEPNLLNPVFADGYRPKTAVGAKLSNDLHPQMDSQLPSRPVEADYRRLTAKDEGARNVEMDIA